MSKATTHFGPLRSSVAAACSEKGEILARLAPQVLSRRLSNLPRIEIAAVAAGDQPECHRRDLTRYVRLPHRVCSSARICFTDSSVLQSARHIALRGYGNRIESLLMGMRSNF